MRHRPYISRIPLLVGSLCLFVAGLIGACTNQTKSDKTGETSEAVCAVGNPCDVTGGMCHVSGPGSPTLTCTTGSDPAASSWQTKCAPGWYCDSENFFPGCVYSVDGGSEYLFCDLTKTVLEPSVCGDDKIEWGEECDPPSDPAKGSCTSECKLNRCGDGIVVPFDGEACDLGANNGMPGFDCTLACQLPVCGDGIVQSWLDETCDDGNTVSGDGCSSTCQLENICQAPTSEDIPCVSGTYGCIDDTTFCDATPGDPTSELDCQCFNGPDGTWPTQPYGTLLPPGADCSSTCIPFTLGGSSSSSSSSSSSGAPPPPP